MSTGTPNFRAPKGTGDLLPPESWTWSATLRLASDLFAGAGYAPVETPIFEHTEVFERGVGPGSEVVGKQMYTFEDKGGRSLTLRPEGTAPVVRAFLEHGLDRGPLPVKLFYAGPMFRQERPQKGRHRQFVQVGIEAIGTDSPGLDAEVIEIGARFLERAGAGATLLLNSIGHPDPSCRDGYVSHLRRWLEDHLEDLAPEDRGRVDTNPLRTFDSKLEATRATMADAPLVSDHLCDACRKHFAEVRARLDEIAVQYTLEPRLVRGLDYYTRTTFEYVSGELGSQNAVGGGGRYDGLAEALGGAALPGIGFALGIDRILLAAGERAPTATMGLHAYVVGLGEVAGAAALWIATQLRRAGVGADTDHAGRSLKGQLKDAARSGARWAVIVGDAELQSGRAAVKELATGHQEDVDLEALATTLAARLLEDAR